MSARRPDRLDRPVDVARDHVLGSPQAEMTLAEYGSYTCPFCHAAHEVIAELYDRFGDRMRYVFRHLPIRGSEDAVRAAELAEYAAGTNGRFWSVLAVVLTSSPVGPAFESWWSAPPRSLLRTVPVSRPARRAWRPARPESRPGACNSYPSHSHAVQ